MLYKYIINEPIKYSNEDIIIKNDLLDIENDTVMNYRTKNTYTLPQGLISIIKDRSTYVSYDNSNNEDYNIPKDLFNKLKRIGIIDNTKVRNHNVGKSDYSEHVIQPWSIWYDYNLNPWDADIVKRVLRTKEEKGMSNKESRIMDYEKIIHICNERIRQLNNE